MSEDELKLLETLVMEEAGSDWISLDTKVHITSTILNRIESDMYPNNIYDVTYQKGQYDVVARNMLYRQAPTDSVIEAVSIALKCDTTNGCLGFFVKENSDPKAVRNILLYNDILFKADTISFTRPKK